MLENSGGRGPRPLLHPPSVEARPRQSQVHQRPPRPRLRGLRGRLLPLRPRHVAISRRRPQFGCLQSPGNPQLELPSHVQVRRLRIWDFAAGASHRKVTVAAPLFGAKRHDGVGEVNERR